ncbi:hypothetical protein BASA60_002365 [Batrachochytrium salamandrivorans]|nr:hypothetical protein BASA60_002365 [Batrachochytrium salamandrivorans]
MPRPGKRPSQNSRFTNVFFTNSVESVNTLGQAYVRPMGVFNDGRCYSSCEVFSGSIQGHGAGTIFGEDKQTGGGGAAVMELDPFLIRASPDDFQKFPFSQELTSGSTTHANTLSVGVTQTVRTGLYKGQTIEDVGIRQILFSVPGGLICSPTPLPTPSMIVLLQRLARTGQKNVEAAGIEKFTVFQADGKTVIAKKRSGPPPKTKFSIPVSAAGSALGNNRITIVGKTAGKQVLKTNRNALSDSVGLYQSSTTAPADGWNNLKGPWMIGNGVKYVKMSILPLRLSSLLPLAPRSILVSMSLSTLSPDVISSTCLSRAVAVLRTSSSLKSRDGTKTFNGISGKEKECPKNSFPSPQSPKGFLFLSGLLLMRLVNFTGATINSFTVSAA